jgi:hypothetical protein
VRFVEMYFNPEFFSWPLLFSVALLFSNTLFMVFKFLTEHFMQWPSKEQASKLLLKSIFVDNWWVYLFCY